MAFPMTIAPALSERAVPLLNPCATWASIEQSCSAATPDFLHMTFREQASCFCYSGASYQPSAYDKYWDSCLSYYATTKPVLYSELVKFVGSTPCESVGNVVAAAMSTPTPTVTSPARLTNQDPYAVACTSWNDLQQSCSDYTPNFSALPFTDQAKCLCYNSAGAWAPSVYDDYWGSCLTFFTTNYITQSPALYSTYKSFIDSITGYVTPCVALGNFRAGQSMGGTMPTSTSSISATGGTVHVGGTQVSFDNKINIFTMIAMASLVLMLSIWL